MKLSLVTTNLSIQVKAEAIPLSAFPKNTTSELAGLPSHYPFFMLNVKQGSCENGRRQQGQGAVVSSLPPPQHGFSYRYSR